MRASPTIPRFLATLLFIMGAGSLSPMGATAQLPEAVRLFDEGNKHYLEGTYHDALTMYEKALEQGYASGALYFNMGNAYYRLDALGQAIRYYEKARRLIPDDPRLLHNLDIARARTTDTFSQLPTPFWRPWWDWLVLDVGALTLFVLGLLFYAGAALLTGQRIWTGTRNPWHRRALSATLLVGLLLFTMAFAASLERTLDYRTVIVVEEIPLREAPQEEAASTLALHEGALLDVLDVQPSWLEVRLPNGVTGWIKAEAAADV